MTSSSGSSPTVCLPAGWDGRRRSRDSSRTSRATTPVTPPAHSSRSTAAAPRSTEEATVTTTTTTEHALSDLFGLAGRTAIVTGASSGLGLGFATTLASAGATVFAAARRLDRLEQLAEKYPA